MSGQGGNKGCYVGPWSEPECWEGHERLREAIMGILLSSKPRSLTEMSQEERQALEEFYGAKIKAGPKTEPEPSSGV